MKSEAVFNDIVKRISEAINGAERSILVVAEHFNHPSYLKILLTKAKAGCSIYLISGEAIAKKQQADFRRLNKLGAHYHSHTFEEGELGYKGFCLIDDATLITGNYNWQETVLSYDVHVIFIYKDNTLFQMIHATCKDLLKVEGQEVLELETVVESTELQLRIWDDPRVKLLQLEKKLLEHHLRAYELEKIELEKVLQEFQYRHSMELGDLLLEILRLRKEQFRDDPEKYREAAADEETYRQEVDAELKKQMFALSEADKKELKKAFRKATHLCHPDKVSEAFKEIAVQVFIKLKEAYDANNLKVVVEILKDLENRQFVKSKDKELSKSVALIEVKKYLQEQINEILKAIFEIQLSDTYQVVAEIEDWDVYFKQIKELLEEKLALLANLNK